MSSNPYSETDAREFFEEWRWPDGPVCPRCRRPDVGVSYNKGKHFWYCPYPCHYRFTVRHGTIMHNSRLSYTLWRRAFDIIMIEPNILCEQFASELQVTVKTASALRRKIRSTMRQNAARDTNLG